MKLLVVLCLFFVGDSWGESFDELVGQIDNHSSILAIQDSRRAVDEEGQAKGRWEEPQLRFGAQNFPSNNIRMRQTPMTGVGVTISQKVPLNSKYHNIRKKYQSLTDVKKYDEEIFRRKIILELWNNAIFKEKLIKSIVIYKENLGWIEGMIKVSNKLYTTGKVSQQAILDLKIRKSQIESNIKVNEILLTKLDKSLAKLLDVSKVSLQIKTVPWHKLDDYLLKKELENPQEMLLRSQLKVSSWQNKENKKNKVPEINVGFNYNHRADIDQNGDFIGAFVSIPIATGARSHQYQSSQHDYSKAQNNLKFYQNKLSSWREELKLEIFSLETELNILMSQTIKFAKTSRQVVEKRYLVGRADYLELLRSELQLQDFLLKKLEIEAGIKESKAFLNYEL